MTVREKDVIAEIPTVETFVHLLENNPGLIILKLGAEWCGPCKVIAPAVNGFFATSPPDVVCGDIDVDRSPRFYSFLRSKKMVHGIPVILCYKRGNDTYIPDDSITGADAVQLHQFFVRCGTTHLNGVRMKNPPIAGPRR